MCEECEEFIKPSGNAEASIHFGVKVHRKKAEYKFFLFFGDKPETQFLF